MNLHAHYTKLYENAIRKIEEETYDIDPVINAPLDNRFGITLIIRPPDTVKNNIQTFLKALKAVDPTQYYYNNSDIHVTVLSIIPCYHGFRLEAINIEEYISIINNSLIKNPKISIEFKGVTASPSCIMIPGYTPTNLLNLIRNNLRKHFKNSNLQQSIDKRYAIKTAHTTVVRFQNKLRHKLEFLKMMQAFRNHHFGSFEVPSLELVYNDWYQKENKVKKLYEFKI